MTSLVQRLSPERDRVLIAANPKAGWQSRDRHLKKLAEWLERHGIFSRISGDLAEVECLARTWHAEGSLRALVAAGGDGTLAELANRTEPGTPLAHYPCGNANLVARYAGSTRRVEPFGQMLRDGLTVRLDAGHANGRVFLAVCSCGFDAEVVRRVHAARRGHITSLAYAGPIFGAIGGYTFPNMRIYWQQADGQTANCEAAWAFVSNLPCYAGGLQPGVGANGADGQLDLCTLRHGSLWHGLRYLPFMLAGVQRDLNDCIIASCTSIRLESSEDVPYEVDGDFGGLLPLEIGVLPGRFTLIASNTFIERMGIVKREQSV